LKGCSSEEPFLFSINQNEITYFYPVDFTIYPRVKSTVNIKNMSKNVLFVCSANKQRSKTGEDYFSGLYPTLHFQSAGTNLKLCEKEGTNPLTEEMLIWADLVLVMKNKHSKLIKENTSNKYGKKVIVLAIEDRYKYYQKELIDLLVAKTEKYFQE
jgi:predicted protein tyrosine phosphatase